MTNDCKRNGTVTLFAALNVKLITRTKQRHAHRIHPAKGHLAARCGCSSCTLLTQILFAKYRARLPLPRQSEIYAHEGIDLNVSTLAGWVGATAATLMLLVEAIRTHVFTAARIPTPTTQFYLMNCPIRADICCGV